MTEAPIAVVEDGSEPVDKAIHSDPTDTESNLVKHARYELTLLGEDQDVIDGYARVIQAFADMGHSGGSASIAIPIINELLQFKNLMPLTNDSREWVCHKDPEPGEPGLWQNVRCGEAFSTDGGKTYQLLSETQNPKNKGKKMLHYAKAAPVKTDA